MKRGDIVVVSGGGDYTGKPRPALIIQDDRFAATHSVTLIPFSSQMTGATYFRIAIKPSPENGLRQESELMIDKIVTIRRDRIDRAIGKLAADDLMRVERAMMVFLGLAD